MGLVMVGCSTVDTILCQGNPFSRERKLNLSVFLHAQKYMGNSFIHQRFSLLVLWEIA